MGSEKEKEKEKEKTLERKKTLEKKDKKSVLSPDVRREQPDQFSMNQSSDDDITEFFNRARKNAKR